MLALPPSVSNFRWSGAGSLGGLLRLLWHPQLPPVQDSDDEIEIELEPTVDCTTDWLCRLIFSLG